MYLLDTNVVIHYLNKTLPIKSMDFLNGFIDEHCYVSIIVQMEALGFDFKKEEEQDATETFIENAVVIDLNADIVQKTIAIRKSKKIDLPDAIIAATALVHGFTLLSRNVADFKNIEGLKVIDPYTFG